MSQIRSEYIKKLMNESSNLDSKLKEVVENTIGNIVESKAKKGLKKLLSEAKDKDEDYDVEDVDDTDVESTDDGDDDSVESEPDDDSDDEYSEYKDEDGDYDLTGMSTEELTDVLKKMQPDDLVKIVKTDDGDFEVTDQEGETSKLDLGDLDLDLDDDSDEDDEDVNLDLDDDDSDDDVEIDVDDDSDDDDDEIEVDTDDDDDMDDDVEVDVDDDSDDDDEIEVDLDEGLGYTDSYQRDTAMTTLPNREVANPRSTYSMDGGIPTGSDRPWPGRRKCAPYCGRTRQDECGGMSNECGDMPIREEDMPSLDSAPVDEMVGGKAYQRSSGKRIIPNSGRRSGAPYGTRHKSVAGEYNDALPESVKRKLSEIIAENKQLKKILPSLKNRVNEMIVVNNSLGNVVKLMNENSTTLDEKRDILRRFNTCRTLNESNMMYKSLSMELKRAGKSTQYLNRTMNGQLSESRHSTVETPMYQSEDLTETLNFMNRLDKIK